MQYDVLASAPLTATGQVTDNASSPNNLLRLRIKGLYFINGATAGSVVFRDGGASGSVLLTLNTPASTASGASYIIMPGEGILVETNLHGTVTTTTSVVVFYG
jgi:hypothetical protein